MGLCGSSRCACGLTTDGTIDISGSGESGDPYVLGVADPHADTAWGTVGYAQDTTTQVVVGTSFVDRTGLSVTWTAVSGRRYRTTVFFPAATNISGTPVGAITDGSNTLKQEAYGSSQTQITVSLPETGLSGSVTRKARVRSLSSGWDSVGSSTMVNFILVEDIGPS